MTVEYIRNNDFQKLIQAYIKHPNDEDIRQEVTLCFYLLSENIIRAFNFKLIDREDALQEGVLICFTKVNRFDPKRGKAFNWFTTIILNHFRQLYRSCKNELNVKKRYIERQSIGKETFTFEGASSEFVEDFPYRVRRNYTKCQESWSEA